MSAEERRAPEGIYRLTSVARPVDPAYPTNRLLLMVLPGGAALFGALSLFELVEATVPSAIVSALLVGFATWALTRELTPDDDSAAFVALLLAWTLSAITGATGVLLPFAALFLARIVNRTTGLAARPWDVLLVAGFVLWAAWQLGQPLLALVAALAFAADAFLARTSALSVAAAVTCAGFSLWLFAGGGFEFYFWDPAWLLPAIVLIAAGATSALSGAPRSRCDAYRDPLIAARVHAGLAVGSFVAAQSLLHGVPWTQNVIWPCLAAVSISGAVRALRSRLAPAE